ncbi:MAG: transcriptional regulator with XRE-family HTH domain [Paracoccaceae bacterium]|jgi:transcriptional regulator with XRE-family HTH domain
MPMPDTLTPRLATRLKSLRHASDWSLDQLAAKSDISRATLSRLEQAKVSPTAAVLGKLCAAYAMPVSRLMMMIEDSFDALIPFDAQTEIADPNSGFVRRIVSPPTGSLVGEVQECHLPRDTTIMDELPSRPTQDIHLILLDGALTVEIDGNSHALTAGDCLRYQRSKAARFTTSQGRGARYLLVLI